VTLKCWDKHFRSSDATRKKRPSCDKALVVVAEKRWKSAGRGGAGRRGGGENEEAQNEIVTLALRHAHMTRRRHAHLPFKSNLAFKKHFSA